MTRDSKLENAAGWCIQEPPPVIVSDFMHVLGSDCFLHIPFRPHVDYDTFLSHFRAGITLFGPE